MEYIFVIIARHFVYLNETGVQEKMEAKVY
jgi:hypothetical protein